ncbi:Retinal dehydrogenase 1 [Gossypium arboreum]|uniref:Retinal dehydrogenase 1 n=1 Tax=Gossypium arboreum TaxID=29729 RepID=A0A0B0NTK7_GOSAR|nr:Retinal dehydrogenase 1 [Gossypium arboreum]
MIQRNEKEESKKSEKRAENGENRPTWEINTAWTSSYGCVTQLCPLAGSKYDLHGRVPTKPKYNPFRKRPILRDLRHSKDYLNT